MGLSINATPLKVYVILFLCVFIVYGILIITRALNKHSVEVEHFEENPDYQYRMEVIKIFDLYMNRNPTPDEISKYAQLHNEQEILLAFLRDFNINASDIDSSKLKHYAEKEVDAIREKSNLGSKVWVEEEMTSKDHDDLESFDQDMVSIPKKDYMECKAKLDELYSMFSRFLIIPTTA